MQCLIIEFQYGDIPSVYHDMRSQIKSITLIIFDWLWKRINYSLIEGQRVFFWFLMKTISKNILKTSNGKIGFRIYVLIEIGMISFELRHSCHRDPPEDFHNETTFWFIHIKYCASYNIIFFSITASILYRFIIFFFDHFFLWRFQFLNRCVQKIWQRQICFH